MKKIILLSLAISKALLAGDFFVSYENSDALYQAPSFDAYSQMCGDNIQFSADIKYIKSNRPELDKIINAEIGTPEELKNNLEEIMQEALQEYEIQKKENPKELGTELLCSREYNIEPNYFGHYQNMEQFSISFYEFLGGAHGIYSTVYLIFNDKNERVTLDKIIPNNKIEDLYQLVLQAYLKYSGVSSVEQYFKDEIYLMLNKEDPKETPEKVLRDALTLDNFYFDSEGLNFSYAPYALAPFSEGEVVLTISYEKLKALQSTQ